MNQLVTLFVLVFSWALCAAKIPEESFSKQKLLNKETRSINRNDLSDFEVNNQPSSNSNETDPLQEIAITYGLSGGRLGDNLLSYLHAKWISYKYQIPLLYVSFPYSDQLYLHVNETKKFVDWESRFRNKVKIFNEEDLCKEFYSTLIEVPYFPDCAQERIDRPFEWTTFFPVEWETPEFHKLINEFISPIYPVKKVPIPDNNDVLVALHLRTTGGYDPLGTEYAAPLKFPPSEFYITALKAVFERFPDRNFYVFVFTDSKDPRGSTDYLASQFKESMQITWCYRDEIDCGTNFVLDDLFSMLEFDCLIRPESNFSIIAEKLGSFKLVVTPKECSVINGSICFNGINVKTKHQKINNNSLSDENLP